MRGIDRAGQRRPHWGSTVEKGVIQQRVRACMAGFMLLCEIRARQRIRREIIFPARGGRGFVLIARPRQVSPLYGSQSVSRPRRCAKALGLH